ncbi:hypothetical protein CCR75_001464 [Bremia lactucae]|uniref:Uncharacterized protein n=1 Tax=Bremia lactucae TaxID=4779 RepID=A0A976IMA7_BRELC|nr:hypothetical protein CCR75_001464 [Bremia lactucae]
MASFTKSVGLCSTTSGKGFHFIVDYRPVNRLIIPLPGATPNLTVVTRSVIGLYGFGQFDLFKGLWQLPLNSESHKCSVLSRRMFFYPAVNS